MQRDVFNNEGCQAQAELLEFLLQLVFDSIFEQVVLAGEVGNGDLGTPGCLGEAADEQATQIALDRIGGGDALGAGAAGAGAVRLLET